MKTLSIAKAVHLPLDLATHVTLVAGKRGSGKTNTAKRIVEQVARAGVPVAILDPADVWWGLRAGRDGSAGGGLPVHVFGGRHADLPLEPAAGALMADVLVEQRISVVMAVREFSRGERARFMTDFAERLIRKNVDPLLVVAEEAHELMPQDKASGPELVALGAMLRIPTLGRSSGLGLLQVTQRLARLNKTATTQSDVLFAHRTIGPQDRDALEEWIKYHHGGSYRAQFMERLPELKTGEAWLWAPDFPEDKPLGLKPVTVLECETFNSHATPKIGQAQRQPKALAPVDLERLRTKMAATIERAKAEDPRELRKRIAELERQIKAKPALAPAPKPEIREVPAISDAQLKRIEALHERVAKSATALQEAATELSRTATAAMRTHVDFERARVVHEAKLRHASAPARPAPAPRPRPASNGHSTDLPKGELAVLKAAAQCGDEGATREQLTILTGYKRSTRDAYIQRARERGLLDEQRGQIVATADGIAALGPSFEPLPTGGALREHWLGRLPEGERKVLEVVCAQYPNAVAREAIGEATGYKRSTRDAYIQRLGTRRLVSAERDGVAAKAELFD